ncbi:phosphotransferase enzyme family protein [Paenibacillus sp. L3-i20]|uniref:phosphotransferase enzyme family protein n=1 Tax=Paenibacillus sp. L3-i20 TaxID=2905833 RepID=UPI001EE13889|nr:phosphotransferase [Paenibacillus sp. L3-i20]GKU78058.1 hypothetical protein L3i20_v224550 [Paenibacillus sp. L3-i20]
MTEKFTMNCTEVIKKTIAKSKNAALRALQNYDLDWEQIRFNQLSDTCTFKIQTTKDGDYLLRIHSARSMEEVNSEILLLDALNEKSNVILPKGVLDRSGSRVVKVDHENGSYSCVSLMRWVEGEHITTGLSEEQMYKEGVLLANLHQASSQFEIPTSFTLPIWGEGSFREAMDRFTQHYDTCMTDIEFSLYQSAAEKILSRMNTFEKDDTTYGLVHGDLHQGNIVFHQGEPRPIDFGRCGFGYFIYDIAHTILGLYPTQRELVVKGYSSLRELGEDWIVKLEDFTVMVMIENYSHHAPDPRETEGLKEEQPYAQAILRSYLSGDPFLFNEIKL